MKNYKNITKITAIELVDYWIKMRNFIFSTCNFILNFQINQQNILIPNDFRKLFKKKTTYFEFILINERYLNIKKI